MKSSAKQYENLFYNTTNSVVDEESEDFFDLVVSTDTTKSEDIDKSDDVPCLNVQTQKTILSAVLSNKEVNTANNASVENVNSKKSTGVFDVVQVQVQTEEKSTETEIKMFEPVQEIINEDVVLVEENINITEYKGGVVAPREELAQMEYPCLYLKADELPAYKIDTLQALVGRGVFDEDSVIYTCYLNYQDTTIQIGYIDNKALRDLLNCSVFDGMYKSVYMSAEHEITGKYLHALCPA